MDPANLIDSRRFQIKAGEITITVKPELSGAARQGQRPDCRQQKGIDPFQHGDSSLEPVFTAEDAGWAREGRGDHHHREARAERAGGVPGAGGAHLPAHTRSSLEPVFTAEDAGWARGFFARQGEFSQEYFVYFKKIYRSPGTGRGRLLPHQGRGGLVPAPVRPPAGQLRHQAGSFSGRSPS